MQVLVTDVTGVVGRILARQLLAAGHAVTGIADYPDDRLHPDVGFVCAPLNATLLAGLTDRVDVVIHLAPIERLAPGNAGIDGLVQVTDAAARAGARMLLVSQAAGQPALYRQAEELVSSSWAPSLIVRVAPLMGRQCDWAVSRSVATLLRNKESSQRLRLLHFDDLIRFLVRALPTDRTGSVDLAAADTVDAATARQVLRSRTRHLHSHRVLGWTVPVPELDTTALHNDWKFECGWPANEALTDTARGLIGRRLDQAGAIDVSARRAMPAELALCSEPFDGTALVSAAPDELAGEFDDRVDPRFPVFSAASLTGALPGPLTPMTLDVQLGGLRIAGREIGHVLALHGTVAAEWESRGIAVFGHRPYIGVSTSAVLAEHLPGWNEHNLIEGALGGQVHDLFPLGRPSSPGRLTSAAGRAGVLIRALTVLRHLKTDTEAYRAAAVAARIDAKTLAALPEARLAVRLQLLRDWIRQGWRLIALWVIDNGVTAAVVQRADMSALSTASGFGMVLKSRQVATETAAYAEALRRSPQLRTLADDGDLEGVRTLSPRFADNIDAAAARMAHRGPGEAELANPVFGDGAGLLLTSVVAGGSAAAVVTGSADPQTLSQRMVTNTVVSRETAHDATMRFTHEMRKTLRAIGARRVGAELIDSVDDVYYLTCDELVTMPSDARLRIKRRRAERERLQALRLPDVFDGSWVPEHR